MLELQLAGLLGPGSSFLSPAPLAVGQPDQQGAAQDATGPCRAIDQHLFPETLVYQTDQFAPRCRARQGRGLDHQRVARGLTRPPQRGPGVTGQVVPQAMARPGHRLADGV